MFNSGSASRPEQKLLIRPANRYESAMRLRVLSDLHLEFWDFMPAPVEADVVILAGDIHVGRRGRDWMRARFGEAPILYVLGNHEFYNHSLPELTETLRRDSRRSRIHLLENSAFEIGGWTFLGCSLWSDFELMGNQRLAMETASRDMSDYHLIFWTPQRRRLRPEDTAAVHAESRQWLREELPRRNPAKTVVITHHAPSARSIPPQHEGSLLNPAFASSLDQFVAASGVPLWIHGHTHHNIDYQIGRTRILSNQRGYPEAPSPGFNPGLVIEL